MRYNSSSMKTRLGFRFLSILLLLCGLVSLSALDISGPRDWPAYLPEPLERNLRESLDILASARRRYDDGLRRYVERVEEEWRAEPRPGTPDWNVLVGSLATGGFSIVDSEGTVSARSLSRRIQRIEVEIATLVRDTPPLPADDRYEAVEAVFLPRFRAWGLDPEGLLVYRSRMNRLVTDLSDARVARAYAAGLNGRSETLDEAGLATLRFLLGERVEDWWWDLLTAMEPAEAADLMETHARAIAAASAEISEQLSAAAGVIRSTIASKDALREAALRLAQRRDLLLDTEGVAEAGDYLRRAALLGRGPLEDALRTGPIHRFLAPNLARMWNHLPPGRRLRIAEAGGTGLPTVERAVADLRALAATVLFFEPAVAIAEELRRRIDELRATPDGEVENARRLAYRDAGAGAVREASRVGAAGIGPDDRRGPAYWAALSVFRNRYAQVLASDDPSLHEGLSGLRRALEAEVLRETGGILRRRSPGESGFLVTSIAPLYPYDGVVVTRLSSGAAVSPALAASAAAQAFAEAGGWNEESGSSASWAADHGWIGLSLGTGNAANPAETLELINLTARAYAEAWPAVAETDEDALARSLLSLRLAYREQLIPLFRELMIGEDLVLSPAGRAALALLDDLFRVEITTVEFAAVVAGIADPAFQVFDDARKAIRLRGRVLNAVESSPGPTVGAVPTTDESGNGSRDQGGAQ